MRGARSCHVRSTAGRVENLVFRPGFGGVALLWVNKDSWLYRNDGGGAFTRIDAGLEPVEYGSVAWGDFDNDGDLYLLLTGYHNGRMSKVYRNQGGGFTDR